MPKNIQFDDPFAALEAIGRQVGVWRWDMRGNQSQWSSHLYKMLGYKPTDFDGSFESFEGMVHPDDRQDITDALDDFIRNGSPYRLEIRMRHKQGHYLHLLTQGAFEESRGDGRNVMVGTVVDVTAEIEAHETAARQAAFLKSMAEAVPGAIFRYRSWPDGSDAVEFISSGCDEIWEVSAADIRGDPTTLWSMVLPEDLRQMQATIERSAKSLAPWFCEWRIETPSGRTKHLEGRGMPEQQEDGSIIWNSLILDVTNSVETRKQLAIQERELARLKKTEALNRLSEGIAHDFNNLLAIIMGNAELLPRVKNSEQHKTISEEVISACQRGAKLTEHILAFSRNMPSEPARVDTRGLFKSVTFLLQRVIPKTIDLRYSIADDISPVAIDESLLESAILNLCLNARDAMPNGGELVLSASNTRVAEDQLWEGPLGLPAGEYVKITIKDTGIGIPEGDLEAVLEPFYTTKEPGRGSGLGLAMVHSLVQQSNGAMEIHSKLNAGTLIELLLPVSDASQSKDEAPHSQQEITRPAKASLRIAVVEDELAILRALEANLKLDGHEVLCFLDGSSFSEHISRNTDEIDLLLTDLVMPGSVQGLDLASRMRELSPHTKVIVMTGYSPSERLAIEGHEDDLTVLQKPISYETLTQAINDLILE